jgi:hypothetical protein
MTHGKCGLSYKMILKRYTVQKLVLKDRSRTPEQPETVFSDLVCVCLEMCERRGESRASCVSWLAPQAVKVAVGIPGALVEPLVVAAVFVNAKTIRRDRPAR